MPKSADTPGPKPADTPGATGGAPAPARLWIVGGTQANPGGLEAYCERAAAALARHATGYSVHLLATDTAYASLSALPRILGRLLALIRARRRIDMIWVQVSNLTDTMFLATAKALGLPVLATPHYGANSRLQTQDWPRRLCRAMLRRADAIGMLFDGQADEIALPDGIPCPVVGTFLPERAFADAAGTPDPAVPPLRLIHAARFSAAKGSLLMIDLCARLQADGVPFEAVLLGRAEPATMAALHERIAAHALSERVTLPGWLGEDATQRMLQEADVLVHLSSIDSFPLIVLEAQAAGALPIVRPMAGGRHMVETHGGLVADGDDPVGSAANWLRSTPLCALRAQGRAAAAKVREECAWPRVAARVVAALDVVRKG